MAAAFWNLLRTLSPALLEAQLDALSNAQQRLVIQAAVEAIERALEELDDELAAIDGGSADYVPLRDRRPGGWRGGAGRPR